MKLTGVLFVYPWDLLSFYCVKPRDFIWASQVTGNLNDIKLVVKQLANCAMAISNLIKETLFKIP